MIVSEALIKSWFVLQRQLIHGLQVAYVDLQGRGMPAGGLIVSYPEDTRHPRELELAARLAGRSGAPVTGRGAPSADADAPLRIACPLRLGSAVSGAVVIEVEAPAERQAAIIERLKWGEAWLNLALAQPGEATPDGRYLALVRAGLAEADYADALTTVLGLLPGCVPCTRVVLGRAAAPGPGGDPNGGPAKGLTVEAVSAVTRLDRRSQRVKAMHRVMGEAVDAGATLYWPVAPGASDASERPDAAVPLHARYAKAAKLTGLCSVPLSTGPGATLVLLFEFTGDAAWDADAPRRCEEAACVAAPLIELRRERDRPWRQRLRTLLAEGLRRVTGRDGRLGRLGLALGLTLLTWLALGTQTYRVSAPATIEGAVQRAVVAPFDGFVAEAGVRAGQPVGEGDLLARLDDRELRNNRRRLLAEQAELRKQHRQAVAGLDHAEVSVIEAQREQLHARLALVEANLARTELRAPLAGLVISGDWSRSLGVPVSRGDLLFEIAPLADYRVAIQVSDRDIANIATGQPGELVLSALPRRPVRFVVTGTATLAPAEAGEPVFRVEARLDGGPAGLRPGMEGVAKVVVGERRRGWVWTHALTDWLRLQLWRWLP